MTEERNVTNNESSAVEGEVVQNGDVAALQERIAQLEKEVAENKDAWLRSAADFRNYKRRIEQERADLIRNAGAALLLKLLPVVDDMERASASVPTEIAESAWYSGFKLIPQKLTTILESEGVTPIDAVGKDFDPNQHEAVIYEDGGEGHNKVTAELQRGYKLNDKVLRPSMVKVG